VITTQTSLEQMKNISIYDINPDSIADSKDISVDTSQPVAERMAAYLRQANNPYFIKVGKVIVKMGFSETTTSAADCFVRYMKTS